MGTRVSARTCTSIVAAVVMAVGLAASAHAAVFCVKASGAVRHGLAARLGCGTNVYSTISDAVSHASTDDTIYVLPGTYSEMVSISSSLSGVMLIGQNPNNTVIDATGQANGILDQASNVTIEGFAIENAAHEGILVEGPQANCSGGQCIPSGPEITGVTIADNVVENNDKALTSGPACPQAGSVPSAPVFEQDDCGEGVHLDGVAFSTVNDNRISNNAGGILLTDETNPNHNNLVTGNTVKDNTPDCGITLPSHPPNGSPLNIGESFGVFNDTIANNLSEDNGAAGTGVFAPTPGTASYGHVIIGNRLIGNTNPGVVFHSHAPHQKISHVSVIGNFISDNGAEANVDSTGDGPANPTGIEVYADVVAAPLNGIDIVGNTIKRESNDIWVGAPSWANCGEEPTPCYNVEAHLNNFQPRTVGVSNQGDSSSVMVNGTENYWGCAKGPGGNPACATATGNVSGTPFLSKPASIGGNP